MVSIPTELDDKMRRHPEVTWDDFIRKVLAIYIDHLEVIEGGGIPMKRLAKKLKKTVIVASKIDLEKAIKYYEEASNLELVRAKRVKGISQ